MRRKASPKDLKLHSRRFQRAVLHFGAPKCGSTYLQRTLDLLRDELFVHSSVLYAPGQWQPRFGSFFSEQPDTFIFNVLEGCSSLNEISLCDEAYMAELEEFLVSRLGGRDLVFSYEGYGDLTTQSLVNMKRYLESFCERVVVLFYVRDPVGYARSAISQRARNGMPLYDHHDALVFPAKRYVGEAVSVFGRENVFVRPFWELRGGDIFVDFCEFLEVDAKVFPAMHKPVLERNKSLSSYGVRLCQEIAKRFVDQDICLTPSQFNAVVGHVAEQLPGPAPEIPGDLIDYIIALWTENAVYLRQEFGLALEGLDEILTGESFVYAEQIEREFSQSLIELLTQQLSYNLPMASKVKHAQAQVRGDHCLVPWVEAQALLSYDRGSVINLSLRFELTREVEALEAGIHILDERGVLAYGTNSSLLERPLGRMSPGHHCLSYIIMADLPKGVYTAGFALAEKGGIGTNDIYWCQANCVFEIEGRESQPSVGYSQLPAIIVLEP